MKMGQLNITDNEAQWHFWGGGPGGTIPPGPTFCTIKFVGAADAHLRLPKNFANTAPMP